MTFEEQTAVPAETVAEILSFEDWKRLVSARSGLAGPDVGYTQWPRTFKQKTRYVMVKQRAQWLKRFGWAHAVRGWLKPG